MAQSDEEITQLLLDASEDFKRLYQKHRTLKEQVQQANAGALPMDDVALENLKKQKLMLKDKMAAMIHAYRREQG